MRFWKPASVWQLLLSALCCTCLGACSQHGSANTNAKTGADDMPRPKITLVSIEQKQINGDIQCFGQIAPDVGKSATVSSKVQAKLVGLAVKLGEHVSKGQTVAWLESKDIGDLQASIANAATHLRTAEAHEQRENAVYQEELIRPHKLTEATTHYKQAKVAYELDQEEYKRVEQLYQEQIASARQRQTARAAYEHARLEYEEAQAMLKRETELFQNKGLIRKDIDLARAETRKAREELNALKQQAKLLGVSQNDIAHLIKGEPVSDRIAVAAPISGEVAQFFATPGEIIDQDTPVVQICDLSSVTISSDVPEADVGKLRVGQALTALVDALPDDKFDGTIASIGSTINAETRTLPVRATVKNANGKLKLNMFANIKIHSAPRLAVMCPLSAVHHDGKLLTVYVQEDGKYKKRQVQTGQTVDRAVEITSGLKPGEQVVTDGSILIKTQLTYDHHD